MNGRYVIQDARNGLVDFYRIPANSYAVVFLVQSLISPGSLQVASEIFPLEISSFFPLLQLHCYRATALFQVGHADIAAGWIK